MDRHRHHYRANQPRAERFLPTSRSTSRSRGSRHQPLMRRRPSTSGNGGNRPRSRSPRRETGKYSRFLHDQGRNRRSRSEETRSDALFIRRVNGDRTKGHVYTEKDLYDYFKQFGPIDFVLIPTPMSDESKNWNDRAMAYVRFRNRDHAKDVLEYSYDINITAKPEFTVEWVRRDRDRPFNIPWHAKAVYLEKAPNKCSSRCKEGCKGFNLSSFQRPAAGMNQR